MSVRVGDRGESKLEVLTCCRLLAEYTVNICRNEKAFPKSSRWIMSQRLVNECLDAISYIRKANSVYASKDEGELGKKALEYRLEMQTKAHASLDTLYTLVDLAFNVYAIEARKIEFWTGLILNADNALKAWMKSDKDRYNRYFK